MSEDQNLEKFLNEVDEISDILHALNSEDMSSQERAILKADQKLARIKKEEEDQDGIRTKSDRTLINTSGRSSLPSSEMSQESFIALLEKDASERTEKRRQNKALATALKDLGNEAFAKGDYETAIQRYSEGLEKMKDMQVLYTNRAQTYIKLKQYENAIRDCEWALKCDKTCVKAYVHMGKAHLGLKNYLKARNCYKKIIDLDISKEKLVKGTAQTLFRINNGFSIIGENCIINRSLVSEQEDVLETDLCLSVLSLWKVVCNENDENQCVFISHPKVNSLIFFMLTSKIPEIQSKTLALLNVYSSTDEGRSLLLKHLKPSRLFESLIKYVTFKDARARTAMDLLYSLTQEERLRSHFRVNFTEEILPSFTSLLKKQPLAVVNMEEGLRCISVMGQLSEDEIIRKHMAASSEFWDSCLLGVDECNIPALGEGHWDILATILGLMFNASLEANSEIKEHGVDISRRCLSLLSSKEGIVLTRSVGVLSRVLPQCTPAVDLSVKEGIVKKLIKLLRAGGKKTSLYAVKVLAVCTKEQTQARKDIFKYDKNFGTLVNLLHSDDEITVGNAALCLGNCFDIPGAASTLLQSDILRLLLIHAGGDSRAPAVIQNAAIALGKLSSAEPRFMTQLRQLHGIEILNSCMKYIK
ncbi:hypothetical protein GDO81_014291 [Engystomops pustulosus]|uniref:Tetratricopeptide repeat domain 12 n=1 Tax=Engystomops pustulosus TaxID=76066 RepID=A0AAV7B9V2_ENGPU|nr:hypothetical protein GDO81_014291 [Engystomops pustulosus]